MVTYDRQLGIFNPEDYDHYPIAIIGCGAIGSFTALALGKMGMKNLVLVDHDRIEEHNISNQYYPHTAVSQSKVNALSDILRNHTDTNTVKIDKRFTKSTFEHSTPIVISCVDSMSVRKNIFDSICKNKNVRLFIDARMGGQTFVVFTVNMLKKKEVEAYKKTLHGNVRTACTERSIIYNVLGVSSIIVNQLKKVLLNEQYSHEVNFDYVNYVVDLG